MATVGVFTTNKENKQSIAPSSNNKKSTGTAEKFKEYVGGSTVKEASEKEESKKVSTTKKSSGSKNKSKSSTFVSYVEEKPTQSISKPVETAVISGIQKKDTGVMLNPFDKSNKQFAGTSRIEGYEITKEGKVLEVIDTSKLVSVAPKQESIFKAKTQEQSQYKAEIKEKPLKEGQKEVVLRPFFTVEGQKQRLVNVGRTFGALNPFNKKEISVTEAAPSVFKVKPVKATTEFIANNPLETAAIATGIYYGAAGGVAATQGIGQGIKTVGGIAAKQGAKEAVKQGAVLFGKSAVTVGKQAVAQVGLESGLFFGQKGLETVTRNKVTKELLQDQDIKNALNKAVTNANLELELEISKTENKLSRGAKGIAYGISAELGERLVGGDVREKSLEKSADKLGLTGDKKDIFVKEGLRQLAFRDSAEFLGNVGTEALSNRFGLKQKDIFYTGLEGKQFASKEFTKQAAKLGFISTAPVAAVEGAVQSGFQDIFRGQFSLSKKTYDIEGRKIEKESSLGTIAKGGAFGFLVGGGFGAALDATAFKAKGTSLVSTPTKQKTVLTAGYLLDVPFEFLGDKADDVTRFIQRKITGKADEGVGVLISKTKKGDFGQFVGLRKTKTISFSPTTGLAESKTGIPIIDQSPSFTQTPTQSKKSLSSFFGITPSTVPSKEASFIFGTPTPTQTETQSETQEQVLTETPTDSFFPSLSYTPTINNAVPFFAPPVLPYGSSGRSGARRTQKFYKEEQKAAKQLYANLIGNRDFSFGGINKTNKKRK